MGYKNLGHKQETKNQSKKVDYYRLGANHGGIMVDKNIPPDSYAGHPKIKDKKSQKQYEKGLDDFLQTHEVPGYYD